MPLIRNIMLVEDNEDDAFLTKRALKAAGVTAEISRCDDGQKVLDYLDGVGPYHDRRLFPLPQLILLDLKLPRLDGLSVLRWIREHPLWAPVVVMALTSSCEKRDVDRAYQLHANAYLIKPGTLQAMTEIAQGIRTFWLEKAVLFQPSFPQLQPQAG